MLQSGGKTSGNKDKMKNVYIINLATVYKVQAKKLKVLLRWIDCYIDTRLDLVLHKVPPSSCLVRKLNGFCCSLLKIVVRMQT